MQKWEAVKDFNELSNLLFTSIYSLSYENYRDVKFFLNNDFLYVYTDTDSGYSIERYDGENWVPANLEHISDHYKYNLAANTQRAYDNDNFETIVRVFKSKNRLYIETKKKILSIDDHTSGSIYYVRDDADENWVRVEY